MKKCSKCGKIAFFNKLYENTICYNCLEKNKDCRAIWYVKVLNSSRNFLGNYKKSKSQLSRMWKAISQAEQGNYDFAISEYRKIIFDEKLGFIGDSHLMRLIEFCYKSQKFNEAWTYLQQYKIMYPHLMYKIINYEIKILKKENRYVEAIRFLPRLYLYDINGFFASEFWNKEKFEKEARIILRQTTSTEIENNIQYLEYLISNFIKYEEYDVTILDKYIVNFIKEINLENKKSNKK